MSLDSEEHGNGSIAGESCSPHSNYGEADIEPDVAESELNRSGESEVFVNVENTVASRTSPSLSVESSPSKQTSVNTSPIIFTAATTESSPQLIITKHSSKSNSPKSDSDNKISPNINRDKSPVTTGKIPIERLHVFTEDRSKSPVISKVSPKPTKLESPKRKLDVKQLDANCEAVDRTEGNDECICWRKPLIDQIVITDVTSNLVTVTVRESNTDKGFFRKRS